MLYTYTIYEKQHIILNTNTNTNFNNNNNNNYIGSNLFLFVYLVSQTDREAQYYTVIKIVLKIGLDTYNV